METTMMRNGTYCLGVYLGHDMGVVLLRDGEIAVAIEEERLTRVKHALTNDMDKMWSNHTNRFGYFPWASVTYCLRTEQIGLDDISAIVLPPFLPRSAYEAIIPIADTKKIIVLSEPLGATHHYCHALSTFYASGFDRAAVLVIDGGGSRDAEGRERESGYVFERHSSRCSEIFKNRSPSSDEWISGLGWFYEYVSAALGFVKPELEGFAEPGKTMGLAPYGTSDCTTLDPWICRNRFKLDFSGFFEWIEKTSADELINFSSRQRPFSLNVESPCGFPANLALKAQEELENAIVGLARELKRETNEMNVCLAGGVALNCVSNGKLVRAGIFEKVFIQPASGDSGIALGLAYHGHIAIGGESPSPMHHTFTGRTYETDEIAQVLRKASLPVWEKLDQASLVARAAQDLAGSKIIGWYQGGSEFGPRALGHRSILADPRAPWIKHKLNSSVKHRELFRPFGASVLREFVSEVFDASGELPFMLATCSVKEAWREQIPAVTHVDGTSRIQTVSPDCSAVFHALLWSFYELTGIPLVLNTSMNLRGDPIAETPIDAVECLLLSNLEVLYIGPYRVRRPHFNHLIFGIANGWELVEGWSSTFQDKRRVVSLRHKRTGNMLMMSQDNVPRDFLAQIDGQSTIQELFERSDHLVNCDEVRAAIVSRLNNAVISGAMTLALGDMTINR